MPEKADNGIRPSPPRTPSVPYGSNAVRLTAAQWAAVGLILVAVWCWAPWVWQHVEHFDPGANYRIPDRLSNDYWLFSRYAGMIAENDKMPVIGDSVIWGQYVRPDETLSQALNAEAGGERFVNLGVNGIHPVALAGLLEYYAKKLAGKKVVLHYNPLWMSSARRDLQDTRGRPFNHPKLVPQFYPNIPSYTEDYTDRFSIAVARQVPFLSWTAHLRHTYFDDKTLPAWTIEHPYDNPVGAVTLSIPRPQDIAPSEPMSWLERGMMRQQFAWVPLNSSLQWMFFKRSLETLRERNSQVFVLVGPFNEHMLTDEGRPAYRALLDEILAWLQESRTEHFAFSLLPSEQYADASHPLKEGYTVLARELLDHWPFTEFLSE